MTDMYVLQNGWMADFKPEPFTEREAFLWSIEQASRYRGHERCGITHRPLERGELLISTARMARLFGWSAQRVRAFGLRMVRDGRWTIERAGDGILLITVCAFDLHCPPQGGLLQ